MVQGSCISDNRNLFHQLETYMENNVAIKTIIEPNIFSNNIWTPIWRVIRKTHNVQLLKAYGIKNKRRELAFCIFAVWAQCEGDKHPNTWETLP